MNRRFTASGLARHFEVLAATADAKMLVGAGIIVENTKRHIVDVFGDQEKLAELQPETVAAKSKADYDRPDAPLIATGELRDSFETDVRPTAYGAEAGVGTEDEKMFWHEFGTNRVPPRPAMAIGSAEASPENFEVACAVAGAMTTGSIMPTKIPGSTK